MCPKMSTTSRVKMKQACFLSDEVLLKSEVDILIDLTNNCLDADVAGVGQH